MENKHLFNILDSSDYCIFSLDLDLNLTFFNKESEFFFNVKKEEVLGRENPLGLDPSIIFSNLKLLSVQNKLNLNKIWFNNGMFIDVEGHMIGIKNSSGKVVGVSFFIKNKKKVVSEKNKDNLRQTLIDNNINTNELSKQKSLSEREGTIKNNYIRKRSFNLIRLLILSTLVEKRKTINQIAKDVNVNWKTVENHLTYLVGKKKVKEVFSSSYVRIFEITDLGRKYLTEIEEPSIKVDNHFLYKNKYNKNTQNNNVNNINFNYKDYDLSREELD